MTIILILEWLESADIIMATYPQVSFRNQYIGDEGILYTRYPCSYGGESITNSSDSYEAWGTVER